MFRQFIEIVDLLLFPRSCIGCKKRDESLCLNCAKSLTRSSDYRDDNTHSLFSYDDKIVKKAILRLKLGNDQVIAKALSVHLADLILSILSESLDEVRSEDILIVPIPISKKSYRARGYNQSEIITEEVARLTSFATVDDLLIKTKATKKQAKISKRAERLKNVVGSFGILNGQDLKKKTVFLVDDVITTGATMREARGELLRAGARRVFCISLASQPLL